MSKKKLPYVLGLLILLTMVISILYPPLLNPLFPLKENKKISSEQYKDKADEWLDKIEGASDQIKLVLVGKEYIFRDDLEFLLSETFKGNISDDSDDAIEVLIESSIVLQEASVHEAVNLTPDYFNNPFKNQELRSSMVNKARMYIQQNIIGGYTYDLVTVWFYNQYPGKIEKEYGDEYAKNLAYQKISDIYQKVINGEVTLQEAKKYLTDDQEVIDLSSKGQVEQNSYLSSLHVSETKEIFPYNIEYSDELKKLKKGTYSKIFLVSDRPGVEGDNPGNALPSDRIIEAYYAFLYVLDNNSDTPSYNNWLEDMKTTYVIERYD